MRQFRFKPLKKVESEQFWENWSQRINTLHRKKLKNTRSRFSSLIRVKSPGHSGKWENSGRVHGSFNSRRDSQSNYTRPVYSFKKRSFKRTPEFTRLKMKSRSVGRAVKPKLYKNYTKKVLNIRRNSKSLASRNSAQSGKVLDIRLFVKKCDQSKVNMKFAKRSKKRKMLDKKGKAKIKNIKKSIEPGKNEKNKPKRSSSRMFAAIIEKHFPSMEQRINKFRKSGGKDGEAQLRKMSADLKSKIRRRPTNRSKSLSNQRLNSDLYARIKKFFDCYSATKSDSKFIFKEMGVESIKEMHLVQSIVNVPFDLVKTYFQSVTFEGAHRELAERFISADFKHTMQTQFRHFFLRYAKTRLTTAKMMHLAQALQKTVVDQRICNAKSGIHPNRNQRTLQKLQDFGIDIQLRQELFGDKVKPKHLKVRQSHSNTETVGDACNKRPTKVVSHESKPSLTKKIKINKQPSKAAEKLGPKYCDMVKVGLKQVKSTNLAKINRIITNNQSYLHTLNVEKLKVSGDVQKPRVSQLAKVSTEERVQLKSLLLYSFRDDTTIGNRTNAAEDFDMVKVNSKSLFDLSNINWSVSRLTKTQSIGTTVEV